MKPLVFISFLLLFLFSAGFVNAQKIEPASPATEKKGIALRPNSRDYGANQRDNNFQRVENNHDGSLYIKKRPSLQQNHKLKQQKKANLKKNQNFPKRKMRRQRKPL